MKLDRTEIRAALRQLLPVLLAVMPFGMVYGAIAVGSGLTLLEMLGLTASVFAGASQLAALQLVGIGAPLWSVLLTVAALNFRHVLYSASIGRHLARFSPWQKALAFFFLADPTFAAAEARSMTRQLSKTYYFTYAFTLYSGWVFASLLGGLFGRLISDPRNFGLDVILPTYFLALLTTFRHRQRFLPVALTSAGSSIFAFILLGPPWHVMGGGLIGILVAALLKPSSTIAGKQELGTQEASGRV